MLNFKFLIISPSTFVLFWRRKETAELCLQRKVKVVEWQITNELNRVKNQKAYQYGD